MKFFAALSVISLIGIMRVQADPADTAFCMFSAGQNSRISDSGLRFPTPDLSDFNTELATTPNPVFSEAYRWQWHLDQNFALVKEDGSSHLVGLQKRFAEAPDGSVWNVSDGRLHSV